MQILLPSLNKFEKCISAELLYSCRFLADQLREIAYESDIVEDLGYFMDELFLYWLEILSLMKHVTIASEMLSSMATWIKVGFSLSTETETDVTFPRPKSSQRC
jgi:hypothetical protein